jgi:hypothetical protein
MADHKMTNVRDITGCDFQCQYATKNGNAGKKVATTINAGTFLINNTNAAVIK